MKKNPGRTGPDSAILTRIAIRTPARFAERKRRQQKREPTASQLEVSLDETAVADFASNPFTVLSASAVSPSTA